MKRNKQIVLLKNQPKAYGGELLKTRKGRSTARPLDTQNTMHLVMRSTKAVGAWSFKRPHNENKIHQIVKKFSQKFGVKVLSIGNVGNHLHMQIKLNNRYTYRPFIRAITASITMAVTGTSRWNKIKKSAKDRFWDYRPFTRIVESFRGFLNLRDYIKINQLEGYGYTRDRARFIVKNDNYFWASETG